MRRKALAVSALMLVLPFLWGIGARLHLVSSYGAPDWLLYSMGALSFFGGLTFLGIATAPSIRDKRYTRRAKEESERREKVQKEREKALKELGGVRQEANPMVLPRSAPPPSFPSGSTASPANVESLEEFPIGQKIGWEVTRLVEGQTKRITIVRGMVAIKADRLGRPPKFMFVKVARSGRSNLYFIDPQRIIKVTTTQGRSRKEVVSYKVVFHEFTAEAMKIDGTIEYSDELEMILADAGLDQFVQIASSDLGFRFTPALRNALIIVAVMGFLMGLALNGSLHLIPTVHINWVP